MAGLNIKEPLGTGGGVCVWDGGGGVRGGVDARDGSFSLRGHVGVRRQPGDRLR